MSTAGHAPPPLSLSGAKLVTMPFWPDMFLSNRGRTSIVRPIDLLPTSPHLWDGVSLKHQLACSLFLSMYTCCGAHGPIFNSHEVAIELTLCISYVWSSDPWQNSADGDVIPACHT